MTLTFLALTRSDRLTITLSLIEKTTIALFFAFLNCVVGLLVLVLKVSIFHAPHNYPVYCVDIWEIDQPQTEFKRIHIVQKTCTFWQSLTKNVIAQTVTVFLLSYFKRGLFSCHEVITLDIFMLILLNWPVRSWYYVESQWFYLWYLLWYALVALWFYKR